MNILKMALVASLTISILFLNACKKDPAQKIVGAWQEVRVINPKMDEAIEQQRVFADTVGTSTDSIENFRIYGTTNIDSFKTQAKADLDSFLKNQYFAIRATIFEFKQDGTMYLHSLDGIDTAKWAIDDDGALILNQEGKTEGNKIRMELVEVSDTLLQLKYKEQYLESTAVFKPAKK